LKPAEEVLVNEKAGSTDQIQATVPLRVSRGARIEMSRAIAPLTDLDFDPENPAYAFARF